MLTTANRTVGLYDAKTNFSRLIDEVAAGETITITRHGVPVAIIVPVNAPKPGDVVRAYNEWVEYRRANRITLGDDLTIRELIEEGRR